MKLRALISILLVAILALSACGNDDEVKPGVDKEDYTNKKETPVSKEEEKVEKEETTEEPIKEKEDAIEKDQEKNTSQGSTDFSKVISYMEEVTEGTAKVLYENNEQQTHKMEDLSISLDGYTFLELNDFHRNYEIPFRDQTDGVVILAKYTVTNDSDKDAHFMPSLSMFITNEGRERAHSNNNALTPKEEQLTTKLGHSTNYLIKAGETISGYEAYSFGKTEVENLMALSVLDMRISPPQWDLEDFSTKFGEEGRFRISLSDDGAETAKNNSKFYEDKVTFDNMGEKKMIKEKSAIGETKDLRNTKVTLEGYQFTEFTPNKEEAPRFENFQNGIVLLTVNFEVENNEAEPISLYGMSTKLTVNNGTQYQLNEGMLLKHQSNQTIEPGKKDSFLQIFILDQEQYEKIWKEKDFEIEVGPFKNEDGKDISKGQTIQFTLPN